MLNYLRSIWVVPNRTDDFVRAQVEAMKAQAPLVYLVITINTALLAVSHFGKISHWLSLAFPAVMAAANIYRMMGWIKVDLAALTPDAMRRRLHQTLVLTLGLGVVFSVWGLVLFYQDDAETRAHVLFYMASTTLCSAFGLTPLRHVSLGLIGLVVVPYLVITLWSSNLVQMAIAGSMIVIAAIASLMILGHHREFARVVEQRRLLAKTGQDLQELYEEKRELAAKDTLTGLANRYAFFSALDLAAQESAPLPLYVALFDLDRFKAVNDTQGHTAGDELLRQVGQRLTAAWPGALLIARLGGDEFGVIFRTSAGPDHLARSVEEVARHMSEPYHLDVAAAVVTVSASAGIARAVCRTGACDSVYERADTALYDAKRTDGAAVVMFAEHHAARMQLDAQIKSRLARADIEADFGLVYQPVVSAGSGRIIMLEALARWQDPLHGGMPTDRFMATAEQSGVINQITLSLYRKLRRDMLAWPAGVRLSFNLSARTLCSPETMLRLVALSNEDEALTRRINFEVTESAAIVDIEQSARSLALLRSLGAHISLDDFGTGFASLANLQRLPIQTLKIDRSFVAAAPDDRKARKIINTIAAMCRELDLECVAEGIETADQNEIAKAAGCTALQGYYYSAPVSRGEVAALLQSPLTASAIA